MKIDNNKSILNKKDTFFILLLIFLAPLFLLLFSSTTSPMYNASYGNDSAYFMMTGRQVLYGDIPYLDFFDMKGPMIFFINALGLSIYDERIGIFILQCIFFVFTSILMYILGRLFSSSKKSLVGVLLGMLILSITFSGGNFTEEYSLPFVLLPLILCCYHLNQGAIEHPPTICLIYGICFGLLVMTRLTNAAIIMGIVLFYVIYLLNNKKIANLLKNAFMFLAGMIIAFIPFIIYFCANNAFEEMIRGTFVLPYLYSQNGVSVRSSADWFKVILKLSPAIFSLAVSLFLWVKNNKKWAALVFLCSLFTIICFIQGEGYTHYFGMTVPIFLLAFHLLINKSNFRLVKKSKVAPPKSNFRETTTKRSAKTVICTVLIAVSCLGFVMAYAGYYNLLNLEYLVSSYSNREESRLALNEYKQQAAVIPDDERDSVWGYNTPSSWFCVTKISPCQRYSAFQYHFSYLDPSIDKEINTFLASEPPKWILSKEYYINLVPQLKSTLKNYEPVSEVNEYILFKQK